MARTMRPRTQETIQQQQRAKMHNPIMTPVRERIRAFHLPNIESRQPVKEVSAPEFSKGAKASQSSGYRAIWSRIIMNESTT